MSSWRMVRAAVTQIFAGLGKMKLFSLIDEKLGAVIILDIMYML